MSCFYFFSIAMIVCCMGFCLKQCGNPANRIETWCTQVWKHIPVKSILEGIRFLLASLKVSRVPISKTIGWASSAHARALNNISSFWSCHHYKGIQRNWGPIAPLSFPTTIVPSWLDHNQKTWPWFPQIFGPWANFCYRESEPCSSWMFDPFHRCFHQDKVLSENWKNRFMVLKNHWIDAFEKVLGEWANSGSEYKFS